MKFAYVHCEELSGKDNCIKETNLAERCCAVDIYIVTNTSMFKVSLIHYCSRFSADFLKEVQRAAENHMIEKGIVYI